MERDEYAGFANELDRLGRRIEMRMMELKKSGRFREDFEGPANEILARQELLRDRAANAVRSGKGWEIMKAELERDYSSLFDNALSFERRIDEDFAKNQE
jgi:hypothetical protein